MTIIIATTLLSTSCKEESDEPISGAFTSASYIQSYTNCEQLEIKQIDNLPIIEINIKGRSVDFIGNESKNEFKSLAVKYNDTSFNKKIVPFTNIAINDSILAINIKCNKEICGVKEGTELNNYFKFYAKTAYDFVQNGYKTEYPLAQDSIEDKYLWKWNTADKTINCKADDIKESETQLIDPRCLLVMESLPKEKGSYSFTITITFSKKQLTNNIILDL